MLSDEQKQKLLQAGYSDAKIAAYERSKGFSQPEQPGFVSNAASDIKTGFRNAQDRLDEGIERSSEAGQRDSFLGRMSGRIGAGFRFAGEALGEIGEGAFRALPGGDFVADKTTELVEQGTEKVGQTKFAQNVRTGFEELPEGVQTGLRDAGNTALGGLGIGGALTGTNAGTRTLTNLTRSATSKTLNKASDLSEPLASKMDEIRQAINPKTRVEMQDNLYNTYQSTLIENRKSTLDKLEKQAAQQSLGENKVTRDNLIRNVVDEGYMPEVSGRKADFTNVFEDIDQRQQRLMTEIDPLLETIPEQTQLSVLKQQAAEILRNSPQVVENLDQSLAELDRMFGSFATKYGDTLTAKQVNEIRKAMNSRTRSFNEEAFKQDTADGIADAMRSRLDEIAPSDSIKQANQEWARLQSIDRTVRTLHNQDIDVGILGRALGSYASTIAASGLGLSMAGPGGLVIAGLVAHYGGDAFAQFLRNRAFSPKLKEELLQAVRSDEALRNRLIQEADEANKAQLERLLLPAPAERMPAAGQSETPQVRAVPAAKGEPGRSPQTGRFFRTYSPQAKLAITGATAGGAYYAYQEENGGLALVPLVAIGSMRPTGLKTALRELQKHERSLRLQKVGASSNKGRDIDRAIYQNQQEQRRIEKLLGN